MDHHLENGGSSLAILLGAGQTPDSPSGYTKMASPVLQLTHPITIPIPYTTGVCYVNDFIARKQLGLATLELQQLTLACRSPRFASAFSDSWMLADTIDNVVPGAGGMM